MIKRLLQKDINRKIYFAALAGAVLLRMAIALSQRVFLLPQASGLDDMLMIRAAMSITGGDWLGAYSGIAMAKNMGFAVWLALLHALRIPVLAANAAVWVAACGFATRALRPVLKGNLARLCVFVLLAFQPLSYAGYVQRVYRDAVFPALSLLVFAGAVGFALRLKEKNLRGSVAMALGAGLGLAGTWLTREDGLALLIFAICAFAAIVLFALWHRESLRRLAKSLLALVPFGLLAAGILAFSAVNQAHYGVFMVNDLTGGAFPAAYGAVAAVSEGESGYTARVPVSQAALQRLYAEVPAMAQLQAAMESSTVRNGFASAETGEFGGSFYYALRVAAHNAGLTPDAQSAQAFWARLEGEVNASVAEGRLASAKPSASVIPRFHRSLLVPTAKETGYSFLYTMLFEGCDPRPLESDGTPESIAEVAAYLHSEVQSGYVEGTTDPYYNPLQRFSFALCDFLTFAYCVAVWPLLALALARLWRMAAVALAGLRAKRGLWAGALPAIMALGLLLSFVLRLVIAAYMEVASFGVGTYSMYLSGGAPALLLFCALALAVPLPAREPKRVGGRAYPPRGLLETRPGGGRDMRKVWVVLIALGLAALKLLLAGAQNVYLDPGESPLDDLLMVQTARNITNGQWLGEYGWLTLSKQSFFALWLAVLHALRVPFLLGGQLLWAGAALAAAVALHPVLKKRWLTLSLFALLLFSPSSTANPSPMGYITRPYRDNIFPALCVLCIAGMVGAALRYREKPRRTLGWLVMAGLALAACWLTREDGWWLLPFVLAAAGITLAFILRDGGKRKLARCAALALPFALLAGGLAGWAGMNNAYYGRFILTDFSSGEFADAVGAMTRIEHENWHPKVSVPQDVREELYARLPEFAVLAPYLESKTYAAKYHLVWEEDGVQRHDYSSGAFYWALREAARECGVYETPATAQAYFEALARDINALCDSGQLAAGPPRSGVSPPIRTAYVGSVLAETAHSLWYCATFQDCDARPQLSREDGQGSTEWMQEYLHETALFSAEVNTTRPYLEPMQKLAFRALDVIAYGYGLLAPVLLLAALTWQVWGGVRLVGRLRKKQRQPAETLAWLVQLGLLCCILLRAAMIAFVTVASFVIGTYIMYLASVHPLLLLFGFVGSVLLARGLRARLAPKRAASKGGVR